jgi:hypothetical protein
MEPIDGKIGRVFCRAFLNIGSPASHTECSQHERWECCGIVNHQLGGEETV